MKRRRVRGIALLASAVALITAGVVTAVVANAATGVTPAAAVRYEAESATCQGTIDSNHAGFSGTGFCNETNAVGSYEEWSVTAANAGSATLSLRYANGNTANRPMSVTVNGGAPVTVNFPSTKAWTTWATSTLPASLLAGTNTIRATSTTADGGPNLDWLEVELSATTSSVYQAESATIFHGTVDSDHAGFHGTGFVNLANEVGSYLQWSVTAAQAGDATLTIRYANGTTANRPAAVSVNGGTAITVNFGATGAWTTWANAVVTATLSAGTNTVRVTSTTANGAANIDELTVESTGGGSDDHTPPTAPGQPTQDSITFNSVTVSWAAATDDVGVTAYDLVGDGQLCGTVAGTLTSGTCTGLTANATHSITVRARDAGGNVSPDSPALTVTTPAGGGPFNDPNLVSMFNGTTLAGWTPHNTAGWNVQDGAIHGTGTGGRGWIYYNRQVGTFRWIFDVRQLSGNHQPTVLIWGTTNPIRDALSGIQFQPPNGGHWDYRPGHNNGGSGEFTQVAHTKIDIHQWAQCELIGNMTTGIAKMACGQLSATGTTTCSAVEVLDFKDPTAGQVGPLAIQVHNAGIQDEYKGMYLESPVVTSPDQFITTHC
jgi:hypothetical protein